MKAQTKRACWCLGLTVVFSTAAAPAISMPVRPAEQSLVSLEPTSEAKPVPPPKNTKVKKEFSGGKVNISGGITACQIIGQGFAAGCKGNTLTATVSGLTPNSNAGARYTYQWYRNGKKIENATNKSYTLKYPLDASAQLSVKVTARKAGYRDVKLTSEPTQKINAVSAKVVNTVTGTDAESLQNAIYACLPKHYPGGNDGSAGFTHGQYHSELLGKTYLPIENLCGGWALLALDPAKGHLVEIEGQGLFQVLELKDVVKEGSSTADLRDMGGTHLLQTCHDAAGPNANLMRVVALAPVQD